jgi:hypothetical protein
MKDVYQILEQKQADLDRVRCEIESLRLVAPLLSEDATQETIKKPTSAEKPIEKGSEATGTGSLFSSISSRLRK